MSLQSSLTLFVGLLCALDLLLTLGVIKRLREHDSSLAAMPKAQPAVQIGDSVGEFTATAVDGTRVTAGALPGQTLVGFFSPTCRPCQEKLPQFVRYAAARGNGPGSVLAVVVTEDADEGTEFVAALSPVARVLLDTPRGPVTRAFKARSFPTVLTTEAVGTGLPVVTDNRVALDVPAGTSA
ncbi:TlpA disulfide reductase family protein [Streptomyces sp. NPDC005009]